MDLKVKGKTAVITGGANGIGKSIAEEFAAEGCKVAICDINEAALQSAKKHFAERGYEVFAGKVDVCNPEEVASFASNVSKEFGSLDIWMNNAGITFTKPLLQLNLDEWERVIKVNMNSVFIGTQSAAREMIKCGGGCIINTASFAGIMPTAYKASYAASKAGIIAMTKEFAAELAPHNIRVAAVAPGMIETDMMAARLAGPEREKIVNRIALQRTGRPGDVAKLCLYLASDAASFITGSTYEITGGMYCIQDILVPWNKY